ncbi:MAG TPA: SusD/RagB family nutrient-binding outer membrane lipoprotein [Mucilaginibacter sp.]|jgi:hypothetical protein|nr:SusD/RagB family nutrient-binding outer membrane lipoprotein [Mucilaginibacter sp.]
MKKYISIATVFLTIGMAGCKKDYLSQEVNPNFPSVTTPQYTLAGAEASSATILPLDYPEYGEWGGIWCFSGSYTPVSQFQEFAVSITVAPSPNDAWNDLYSNLTNYNNLQVSSASVPADANFEAIAMIMKAFDFEQLVDNYNNVPYTQAFQPSTILFPAYDSGQFIYNDLVKQLDAAIALISKSGATATNPGTSDVIYGGNMANWQIFANTLKLRLAIRQSNLSTNAAQADLASTASIGYIGVSTEADCQPGYTDALGKQNPFYSVYGFDQNGNPAGGYETQRSNIVASNLMKSLNDPRDSAYYKTVSGAINALQLGNPQNASNAISSPLGPGLLKSSSQPEPIFSSYESLFLQAEAAARGWIPGSAAAFYNAAITASFNAVNAQGSVATYLAQAGVAYPVAGTLDQQVKAIITQKYISLNSLFNLEAYNEFRRTGYPVLPQNPASQDPAAVSQTLPLRIPYPLSELNTNTVNLNAQGNINIFTDKIFWAK